MAPRPGGSFKLAGKLVREQRRRYCLSAEDTDSKTEAHVHSRIYDLNSPDTACGSKSPGSTSARSRSAPDHNQPIACRPDHKSVTRVELLSESSNVAAPAADPEDALLFRSPNLN